VIEGGTDIEKHGLAALNLSAANTFTSHVTVAEGTVSLFDDQALGASTTGTEILEGATLELVGGLVINNEPLDIGRIGGLGTPHPGFPPRFSFGGRGGDNTWTGPVAVWCETCPVSAEAASTLELTGQISGDADAAVQKIGAGTLILSAANTFEGETIVAEGTLRVLDDLALGSAISGTELLSGATLELVGGLTIEDEALDLIADVGVPIPPPIRVASFDGHNLWTGAMLLPFDPEVLVEAGSTLELSGPISGAEDIQKLGGGTLVLSGDSPDYTGTIEVQVGTLLVTGSLPAATVEIDGGTFINQGTVGALAINGTAAADVIRINNASAPGGVEVVVNGVSQGSFSGAQRLIVRGGDGDDDIEAAGSVSFQVWLYGESGSDRLNAGSGGSLLIGGAGNDELLGGGGRDVMIGGEGADRLIGNGNDDILIAGFTTKDDRATTGHDDFWLAILDEWNSSNSFAVRMRNLTDGLGGNAHNGSTLLLPNVRDDLLADAIDFLNGSSGDDWLVFRASEDKVSGQVEAAN
jgi:autotransporter-associated beta strand protein